jgi:hypothetical protein
LKDHLESVATDGGMQRVCREEQREKTESEMEVRDEGDSKVICSRE